MMTYGELVGPKAKSGSIRSWINYSLTDAESVLLDAQASIYTVLRSREMRTAADVSIALNASTADLPARFLDPINLVHKDGSGDITLRSEAWMNRNRLYDGAGSVIAGQPSAYAIYGEALQFECKADAAYTASFLFYQQPAFLSPQNPSNFLTTRYPNLLRQACLMGAFQHRQDSPEFKSAQALFDQILARLNVNDDLSRRGESHV